MDRFTKEYTLYLDHDFEAENREADQLSFRAGDTLRVMRVEGEWR